MNTDLLSTVMGIITAAGTGFITFTAPAGTPTKYLVIGYLSAVSMAVWGYLTNKKP